MTKKRRPKKTDPEEIEKGCDLILDIMDNNPQVEPTVWCCALWSCIINGYAKSGATFKEFGEELEAIKSFYKDHWNES